MSSRTRHVRCALAIAGLDPSGGAGLFADMRAFEAAGVWGCGAVAVTTTQSTAGLRATEPVPTAWLMAQVREIVRRQDVRAIKIGALGSAASARAVRRWLGRAAQGLPVVLDPVMRATRGAKHAELFDPAATPDLLRLASIATLVTPNVPEAEQLLDERITSTADAARAALALVRRGAKAALVKGGHLPCEGPCVIDVLAVGSRVLELRWPRASPVAHGTGCLLSSLTAGRLARADSLDDGTIVGAVRWAERVLHGSLDHPLRIGDGRVVVRP